MHNLIPYTFSIHKGHKPLTPEGIINYILKELELDKATEVL